MITTHRWSRALVFVATGHAAEHVADKLRGLGIGAAALHGRMSQGARTDVLAAFRASELRVSLRVAPISRNVLSLATTGPPKGAEAPTLQCSRALG